LYYCFLFVIESIKILNDIKHSLANNVPKVILQRTLLNMHEKQDLIHVQNRKRKIVYLYYYFYLYYYLFSLLFHITVNYTTNNLI